MPTGPAPIGLTVGVSRLVNPSRRSTPRPVSRVWAGPDRAFGGRYDSVRIRLALLTAAAAVASSLTLTVAAPAASAATPPMLFGVGDHWEPDVAHDDAQLGIQSGIVGLFAKWGTTQTSPVIHWMDWVRARGGAPMIVPFSPPLLIALDGSLLSTVSQLPAATLQRSSSVRRLPASRVSTCPFSIGTPSFKADSLDQPLDLRARVGKLFGR